MFTLIAKAGRVISTDEKVYLSLKILVINTGGTKMKKIKALCIATTIALGMVALPNFNFVGVQGLTSTIEASAATTITVSSSSSKNLKQVLASVKSGDTVIVNGTIKSEEVKLPAGVILKGINNGKIDFSSSTTGKAGITISGDGATIQDLEIYNAKDNGIFITGNKNTLKNLNVHDNSDTGVQLSNGAANNYLYKVTSYHNADKGNGGENADGFAIKLHSGTGNVLEQCIAQYNSDDGYDLYAAHGAVTFKNCQANYNGDCYGIKGDGNGFKLGGVDNKTPGVAAHLDPVNHSLTGCKAIGDKASGVDRNNQSGVVTMKSCTAEKNGKNNYNWPAKGKPSQLGYEVTFGKAKIIDCISRNGSNNISGATLSGKCQGF